MLETALRDYIEYIEGFIFVCMVFALINNRQELGQVLKWLVVVAGLSFFVSLCHYYLGSNSPLFTAVEAIKGIGATAGKTDVDVGGWTVKRFLWPGSEPNYAGAQLIFPLAIGLGLYGVSYKTSSKLFWLLCTALVGFAILGTYSRSSFLAGSVVLLMFLARRNIKALIPAVIVFSVACLVFIIIPTIRERITSIPGNIEVLGGTGRLRLWAMALRLWVSSPIIGHGFASAERMMGHVVHNGFIQVLAENGIIGEILYLAIIYSAFRYLYLAQKIYVSRIHPDVVMAQMITLGLIGTCLNCSTITPQDPKFLWFSCCVAALFYIVSERSFLQQLPEYEAAL